MNEGTGNPPDIGQLNVHLGASQYGTVHSGRDVSAVHRAAHVSSPLSVHVGQLLLTAGDDALLDGEALACGDLVVHVKVNVSSGRANSACNII